ncbi:MAG TPA: ClbS/DfsB family four-helix bundle protein [Herpetosiphonaceae bacterium]
MNEPTSKAELLSAINTEHERLTAALSGLTDEQLVQPGVESDWSVKDVLAHVTWWEQWMVQKLGALARGDKIPRLLRPDEDQDAGLARLNSEIFAATRNQPLDEVRAAFDRSFQQAVAAVTALSEHDIFDPEGLGGSLGEAPLQLIASDTYEHYEEHTATIRRWRDTINTATH